MSTLTSAQSRELLTPGNVVDTTRSGVSWAAIIAGATAAAAISLILFILGFGLGLSAISPWSGSGASAEALSWATIGWVTFTQLVAAGLGGYLAGRLRVKWASVHDDEVYFRDTAHGFLTWALASLLTVALFGSATANIVSGGAKAAAGAASVATAAAAAAAPAVASAGAQSGANGSSGVDGALGYLVDSLFRSEQSSTDPAADAALRREVLRIFANDLPKGELTADDRAYLIQLIARRTGISPAEAEARVTAIYNEARATLAQAEAAAKQAADTARKAAAYTALWGFISLLIGAFVASLAATWGGRQRDNMRTV